MPELPEVETVVRDLRPLLTERVLRRVSAGEHPLRFPWQAEWGPLVTGRRIESVRRRGKWIFIDLADGRMLLAHLGMTGQLTVVRASTPRENHTHLIFTLDNECELRFRDIRRFGSIRLMTTPDEVESLGPEPWDLRPEEWYARLHQSQRVLKAILLDQSIVAGIGNIYADESLFLAGLPPNQRGTATTREQAERLRQAITQVLDQAIAARGSTIRNYVGGSGLEGGFQHQLLVYGRTGQPCARCGTMIQSTRLAGRSTHWCPRCQKSTRARANRGT